MDRSMLLELKIYAVVFYDASFFYAVHLADPRYMLYISMMLVSF